MIKKLSNIMMALAIAIVTIVSAESAYAAAFPTVVQNQMTAGFCDYPGCDTYELKYDEFGRVIPMVGPVYTIGNVRKDARKMPKSVLTAFEKKGYKLAYCSSFKKNDGVFSAKNKEIVLGSRSDLVYEKLGEFVDHYCKMSSSSSFKKIYKSDTRKKGVSKKYRKMEPAKYFAVSVKEYCTNQSKLRRQRYSTYKCIKVALNGTFRGFVCR